MERGSAPGDGLEQYMFTGGSPTPSPFRLGGLGGGGGGLWDEVEVRYITMILNIRVIYLRDL